MKYVNRSRFWRQAGDVLVPPGGVTPELEAPPIGPDWEPVTEEAVEVAEGPVAEETKEAKRGGRK